MEDVTVSVESGLHALSLRGKRRVHIKKVGQGEMEHTSSGPPPSEAVAEAEAEHLSSTRHKTTSTAALLFSLSLSLRYAPIPAGYSYRESESATDAVIDPSLCLCFGSTRAAWPICSPPPDDASDMLLTTRQGKQNESTDGERERNCSA